MWEGGTLQEHKRPGRNRTELWEELFREQVCRKESQIEYKIKRRNYAENKNVGNISAGRKGKENKYAGKSIKSLSGI
jgi:hypothetical protein